MYSFEVSKSKISASEPQKMMVLCRFETMTLLMRHPVQCLYAEISNIYFSQPEFYQFILNLNARFQPLSDIGLRSILQQFVYVSLI